MSTTRIYIAGHRGMVGSAIKQSLEKRKGLTIITRSHGELDVIDQHAVNKFFTTERPDQVYLAAARVGGIHANNTLPANFIYENLMIEANVINAAWRTGVQRLLFLGSSCIYPRLAPQPMTEATLLTGALEPTNEPYAIAKIAGIKLCETYNRQHGTDFRSVMPTNLYGPGDNYHPENSHVIPGLIRRFHEAKLQKSESICVWGTGTPKREFLYTDDMAAACTYIMAFDKSNYTEQTAPMQSHINIGTGDEVTIRELAESIAQVVGFNGQIEFDPHKPDGPPRKLLNVSLLNKLGWRAKTSLLDGLRLAYKDFCAKPIKIR